MISGNYPGLDTDLDRIRENGEELLSANIFPKENVYVTRASKDHMILDI